jgi:hypothetical protein
MRFSAAARCSLLLAAGSVFVVACSGAEQSRVDDQGNATVASAQADGGSDAPPTHAPDCGVVSPTPPPQLPPTCTMPSNLVTYMTPADLEPVIVGKWVRQCGQPEVTGEVDGVEFAADHTFWPLRRNAQGLLERVLPPDPDGGPGHVESWTAFVESGRLEIGDSWDGTPTSPPYPYTYDAPKFTPDGKQMALLYAPWLDLYERAAE